MASPRSVLLGRIGCCQIRLANVPISGSAVTRRFQIEGIRLQLKLGRRPQGARLISRQPEQLRARHRVPLDDADDWVFDGAMSLRRSEKTQRA
jgi:hypothetical protein